MAPRMTLTHDSKPAGYPATHTHGQERQWFRREAIPLLIAVVDDGHRRNEANGCNKGRKEEHRTKS